MTRILQTDLARDALYTKVNQIADEKVSLSEDETITGIKTFSASPLVPTLTGGDSSSKAASTSFVTTAYNDLETRINTKANDNAVVHISGNESLVGTKTFVVSPQVPDNTSGDSSSNAANTKFVTTADNALQTQINAKADDNAVVHLTGGETVTGEKTFNSNLIYKKTSLDFSVIPNTPLYTEIRNVDVNDKEIGQFRVWKDTDSSTHVDLLSRYQTDLVNFYGASVGVKIYPNGDSCGYCEQNAPWAWGALVTLTSQNHSTDGYVKYSNGLIIQWGTVGAGANFSVTFPTPFTSSASYGIAVAPFYDNGADAYALNVKNRTSTGFTGYLNANYGGASYIAIGY